MLHISKQIQLTIKLWREKKNFIPPTLKLIILEADIWENLWVIFMLEDEGIVIYSFETKDHISE